MPKIANACMLVKHIQHETLDVHVLQRALWQHQAATLPCIIGSAAIVCAMWNSAVFRTVVTEGASQDLGPCHTFTGPCCSNTVADQ